MPGSLSAAIDDRPSPHGFDVAVCDREPIHRPGSIQPHGLVLVADACTFRITAGAGDIETALTPHWLGADLDTLLEQSV
ncbi:MAG: phytochrome, partial [Lysobacteraceae bacterium]